MAKHTPEPWEARDVPGAGWQIFARLRAWENRLLAFWQTPIHPSLSVRFSEDGLQLCAMLGYETWCQFPAEGWSEELAANARLIAAAPDLLKACKAAAEGKTGWGDLIDAAIAKAEEYE